MRRPILAAAFAAIAACQPAPGDAPEVAQEVAPEVPTSFEEDRDPLPENLIIAIFTQAADNESARLYIQEDRAEPAFGLECTASALTLSGPTSQVALGNMATPYAISLSGTSFEADLVPEEDAAPTFAVTAPLTPDLLSALSEATTARIMVNDNYAFVESGVDTGAEFEAFSDACSRLSGIAPAP